jgi:hypothetical protein
LGKTSQRSRLSVDFPLDEQPLTATTTAFRGLAMLDPRVRNVVWRLAIDDRRCVVMVGSLIDTDRRGKYCKVKEINKINKVRSVI